MILSGIGTVGTGIAFSVYVELSDLNINLKAVTISSEINNKEIIKLEGRVEFLEKNAIQVNISTRDRLKDLESSIAIVERFCRKWKAELMPLKSP